MGQDNFDIGEAKKLLKCTCGCLDFDIEKVKWRAPPLQQAAVQNEDWVEYEATKLTPEFYTSRIAELKPFVGQKGKIEMHGRNSGLKCMAKHKQATAAGGGGIPTRSGRGGGAGCAGAE